MVVWLGIEQPLASLCSCCTSCCHPCQGQMSSFYFFLRSSSLSAQGKICCGYRGGNPLGTSLGGHSSLDIQTPCKWGAPGLTLLLLTCSQLTPPPAFRSQLSLCNIRAFSFLLQIRLFWTCLMWRAVPHLVTAHWDWVPFSRSRQLHETKVYFQ